MKIAISIAPIRPGQRLKFSLFNILLKSFTQKYFMNSRHKFITIGGDTVKNPFKTLNEKIDSPAIELYCNRRVIVTDCHSVIDYSNDNVVLCIGEKNLRVRGENLIVNSYCFGQTDISGDILSLEFV